MAIVINVLTPADAAAFKAIRLHALMEVPSAFGSSYEAEKDRSIDVVAGGLLATSEKAVFGAFHGKQLIAVVGVRCETLLKFRHKGVLWGMYVTPEHRVNGIAQSLMREAIEFSRGIPGLLQLNLTVNATNAAAIRLYESFGFQVFGREANSMLVDGTLYDEVHMALVLPRSVGNT